jgi:multidrug transporter EmrE-like cation transporter
MTATDRSEKATAAWSAWLWLFVAVVANNQGNFLLRAVSEEAGVSPALFLSGRFVLATVSFGLGFFFYIKALSRLSLSAAYPVLVGTTMIVVAVASYLRFDTPLTVQQLAGTLLVLLGVTLVSTATEG